MLRSTWRFNKLLPGILLAGILIGFAGVGVSALRYHISAGAWWTVVWVSIVYALVLYGLVVALLKLYRRSAAPDCLGIYTVALALVVMYALGRTFPYQTAWVADKSMSLALHAFAPGPAREIDQLKDTIDR